VTRKTRQEVENPNVASIKVSECGRLVTDYDLVTHFIFMRAGESGRLAVDVTPEELEKFGEWCIKTAKVAKTWNGVHPMGQSG
jgi:hypothetical protein